MTDEEIGEYLVNKNYEVDGSEFIIDVMNTSPQVHSLNFDAKTLIATAKTTDGNTFKFKWILHEV